MFTRRRFAAAVLATGVLPRAIRAQEAVEYRWQWQIVGGPQTEAKAALDAIVEAKRLDLIAGMILSMRFSDSRIGQISNALAALTGEKTAQDWFDWMLWQEAHPEIIPHPSYADFMRELHLRIDENFADFLRPKYLTRERMGIRIEEIAWGGVAKDGIPSLDNPKVIRVDQADYMRDEDLVFGVSINGDARAYPLRIMGWHEMLNEVIGGVPVALAYCTLCGSGILYETKVKGRTEPLIFGSSGFLYRSNKLMFDRSTNSLWSQLSGRPVVGRLAASGIQLVQRPVVITTWKDWRRSNPETQILSLDTGFRRNYGSGVVYREYFASDDLMFPALSDQSRQKQKNYVFGIRRFGGAKAWPISAFRKKPVINDTFAGFDVVLLGNADTRSVRAYERGERIFRYHEGSLVSDDGSIWTAGEEALIAADGRSLPRVAGHIAYWFAWNGYLGAKSEYYTE